MKFAGIRTFFVPKTPIYTIDLKSRHVSTFACPTGPFPPVVAGWTAHRGPTTNQDFKLMLFDLVTGEVTRSIHRRLLALVPRWKIHLLSDMHNAERIVRLE
jgi:hypothetical protein